MAPIPILLFFVTIVQLHNKAFSGYIRPYRRDIIKKFRPLQFPGIQSTRDVSDLKEKLSIVQEQIKTMELANQATTLVASTISSFRFGQSLLESITNALVHNLLSSEAALEDLSLNLKIQLGIREALAKHSLSEFNADVRVLRHRLEEMWGNSTLDMKRLSAIPAIQVCETILELFNDEAYIFWELKLIFYPYLMSFTGIYATVAATVAQLLPDELGSLQQSMDLLRATILKYHTEVKEERLSKLYIPFRSQNQESAHIKQIRYYCPKMRVLRGSPSSPFTSCIRGDPGNMGFWEGFEYYWELHGNKPYPEWFKDTLTGEILCGWEGCWNRWNAFYGNEIDYLTMSALKLIPFIAAE